MAHLAAAPTLIGSALQTDRYRASLYRHIYLATGDRRYAFAARPWDDLIRDFRGVGKDLLAELKAAVK